MSSSWQKSCDKTQSVAFFDVCGTLVSIQSTPEFITYLGRENHDIRFQWKLLRLLGKLRLVSASEFRSRKLALLKGWKKGALEEAGKVFAHSVLIPSLRPEVFDRWNKHKDDGHICVIVSRALDVFLQPLAQHIGADQLLCCELGWDGERCDGSLADSDMTAETKGLLIKQAFGNIDEMDTYAYADSVIDISMLRLARNRFYIGPYLPSWAIDLQCKLISTVL